MDKSERKKLLSQIVWDYDISSDDIELVLIGKKELAGHYTRENLFRKIIESYPWFTVLQLFTPNEIKLLLTDQTIRRLRSPSLRKKYEFVQKRLSEIIPVTE